MQNQMNTQYLPNQVYGYGQAPAPYMQPMYQTAPIAPTVGAVNIQIYNPTANAAPQTGFYQPMACAPYPCNYNNFINQTPSQNMQAQTPNPSDYQGNQVMPDMNQTLNMTTNQNKIAGQGDGDEGKKTEDKKEKKDKPKVALTDDYIRTLENYLNSPDKKIRLMGAKELLERFKEDESRKDDAALTALLNKALQDPAETVKFLAMTALDIGHATGNDETAMILNQMQASDSSYGEDAALASQILLKMSGYKANQDAQRMEEEAKNAKLNQNQPNNLVQMPEPSLAQGQNSMNAMEALPPKGGTLLMPDNQVSMNQSMQMDQNGQVNMNQSMVPPMNNNGRVA